jgi:two-component system nitrate/nitrite response regulator NarL
LKNDPSILICDDHQLFSQGLKEVIKQHIPDAYVTITDNVTQCIEVLNKENIDVFICDIKIGNSSGLVLIEQQINLLSSTTIIVLSGLYEDYLLRKAQLIGVHYFLKKEASVNELLLAIQGEQAIRLNVIAKRETEFNASDFLSKKEKEIIKLIIEGFQSKEIAEMLFISKTTVDTHRRNIHRKLNTANSGDLIRLVYEKVITL